MEHQLRTALIGWLAAAPGPINLLNIITEEEPLRASVPWLGLATSASVDWSTKDLRGQEIRIALELHSRADKPDEDSELIDAIGERIEVLPRSQAGFHIVTIQFLRTRTERRKHNLRSSLIEYRFRCLESAEA